jgi:hypothetical protein
MAGVAAAQLCSMLGLTPVHATRLLESAGGDADAARDLFHKDPNMFSVLQRNVFSTRASSPAQQCSMKRPNATDEQPLHKKPASSPKPTGGDAPATRKAQRCTKCGQPRRGHTCPFAPAKPGIVVVATASAPAAAAPPPVSPVKMDAVMTPLDEDYDIKGFLDATVGRDSMNSC